MNKNAIYTVENNEKIARDVYNMRLQGPTEALVRPGQFVNILLNGYYLRRPLSVCRWDQHGFDIIYKVVGRGTAQMTRYGPGTQLDVLTGLGNGFAPEAAPAGKPVVLVGGGVGVPPLYALAQRLVAAGVRPVAALGFASAADVFLTDGLQALGCRVLLATENGSAGEKGYVTGLLEEVDYGYYFACGPQPMLKALHRQGTQRGASGQLSFEERMGCGFGACMGCTCETLVGPRRVCVDGPVFRSEEVAFA